VKFWLVDARKVAEALFCGPGGPPPAERLDWLIDDIHDFVTQSGPRVMAIFTGGVLAATWLAPPLIGKVPPLSRLSIAERCEALEAMEHTPLGLPLLAVKAMLSILYYEHPDSLRDMGVTQGDEQKPGCLLPLRRGASS
jgi:hypothetical protein